MRIQPGVSSIYSCLMSLHERGPLASACQDQKQAVSAQEHGDQVFQTQAPLLRPQQFLSPCVTFFSARKHPSFLAINGIDVFFCLVLMGHAFTNLFCPGDLSLPLFCLMSH